MTPHNEITAPVAKGVSAWAAVGAAQFADIAQGVAGVLAALYSAILLGEWALKRFRPAWAVSRGWVK